MIKIVVAFDDNDSALGDYFEESYNNLLQAIQSANETPTTVLRGLECNEANVNNAVNPLKANPFLFVGLSHGDETGNCLLTENDTYVSPNNAMNFTKQLLENTEDAYNRTLKGVAKSVNDIGLTGVGGTSIATPTVNGNTKTYNIKSFTYQVVKDNTLDTAFDIILDTTTLNVVKYKIRINYAILSSTILTQISNDSGLLTQFNSLVTTTNFNVDLTNLNGACIINLSSISYLCKFLFPF